jgi:hypothetical protein
MELIMLDVRQNPQKAELRESDLLTGSMPATSPTDTSPGVMEEPIDLSSANLPSTNPSVVVPDVVQVTRERHTGERGRGSDYRDIIHG